MDIDLVFFYDVDRGFWNFPDNVVFLAFYWMVLGNKNIL
jgi:hypothetical protein